jgi:hypothetical protein
MLLIVGGVIVLIAVVTILRTRVPGGANANTLGWMARRTSRVALIASIPEAVLSRIQFAARRV